MWHDLLTAFCLMLILEGIFPFLNPKGWQKVMQSISEYSGGQIRMLGLASMILGLIALYLIK